MTEAEWLAGMDPTAMLRFLDHRGSDRKYRLFGVACARDELAQAKAGEDCFNFGEELDENGTAFFWSPERGYEAAVLGAESMADGGPRSHFPSWFVGWACDGRDLAFAALGHDPDWLITVSPERREQIVQHYTNHPALYLHDIFGNPFRQVSFDPVWRSSASVVIAQQMYVERDFSTISILADALQEAGCNQKDVLDHCRESDLHVRGCWVVDLVLDRE